MVTIPSHFSIYSFYSAMLVLVVCYRIEMLPGPKRVRAEEPFGRQGGSNFDFGESGVPEMQFQSTPAAPENHLD